MMVCICVPVPSLFTHVFRLRGTNLQRVALSSFPSSDINIWANSVRQLLVENPQQSLVVTTWECSSEGHALHCDYKQQSESGGCMMPRSSCLACLCGVFLLCYKYSDFFFFLFFPHNNCEASCCGQRRDLQPHFDHDCKRRWLFYAIHTIIAVNISEGRRYWKDLMEAVKTGTVTKGIECSHAIKHTRHSSKWGSLISEAAGSTIGIFITKKMWIFFLK